MNYTDFRNTYRAALKRWPDMGAMFDLIPEDAENATDGAPIGSMIIERYERYPSGAWKQVATEERADVTALHYMNAFDPRWAVFASDERNFTRYTKYGKLPYKNCSTSPDGSARCVRVMTFND